MFLLFNNIELANTIIETRTYARVSQTQTQTQTQITLYNYITISPVQSPLASPAKKIKSNTNTQETHRRKRTQQRGLAAAGYSCVICSVSCCFACKTKHESKTKTTITNNKALASISIFRSLYCPQAFEKIGIGNSFLVLVGGVVVSASSRAERHRCAATSSALGLGSGFGRFLGI